MTTMPDSGDKIAGDKTAGQDSIKTTAGTGEFIQA
jgi:hypothetical protein